VIFGSCTVSGSTFFRVCCILRPKDTEFVVDFKNVSSEIHQHIFISNKHVPFGQIWDFCVFNRQNACYREINFYTEGALCH
jgi:hypothetical protein